VLLLKKEKADSILLVKFSNIFFLQQQSH